MNYGGYLWGYLGLGARPIAVPLDAMVVSGHFMEIVDFTRDELRKFPTFNVADAQPLDPNDTIQVGLARPSH